MSTTFEDRLRVALDDLADDVGLAPSLLWSPPAPRHRSGAWARPLLVAAVVAVLLAGVLVTLRPDHPRIVEPVQQPPKVFRLSGTTSKAPGRAVMSVVVTPGVLARGAPAHLVRAVTGSTVALPPPESAFASDSQRLSTDGRFLVRGSYAGVGPTYVLVDLASGHVRQMTDPTALFATLSPDDSTLAVLSQRNVTLVDATTGTRRLLRRLRVPVEFSDVNGRAAAAIGAIGALGWSPTGALLAVNDGHDTVLVDRSGAVRATMTGARMVNGSQSWSPDGRRLLVYDGHSAQFSARSVAGARTVLLSPPGAVRPLGWSGSHVVWLTGDPGSQRLVTCEVEQARCRTWMRFDVGSAGVEGVTWSSDLAGTSRP